MMKTISIFLLLLFCNQSYSQDSLSLEQLKGTWVNEQYSNILNSKRSPKEAYYQKGLEVAFFDLSSKGIQWGIHDGNGFGISELRPAKNKDEYLLIYLEGQPSEHKFILNPSDSLQRLTWIRRIGSHASCSEHFIRIDCPFKQYINRTVIAGTYLDKHGKEYKFQSDGLAQWPDKQFKYRVRIDCDSREPDQFIILEESGLPSVNGFLAFKWDNDKLFIFLQKPSNLDDGERLYFESKPFVVLRKK